MAKRRTLVIVLVLVFIAILSLFGFGALTLMALFHEEKPTVREGSVLVLDLGEEMQETTERPLLAALRGGPPPSLTETVRLLRAAAEDDRIARVLVRGSMMDGVWWGGASELREGLLAVQKAGKPVDAYFDYATDLSYYIAAAADRIAMPPTGALLLDGFYGEVFFFKNLLAKADISFEDVHAGSYKSAPEVFTRESMSGPYREQLEALLDDRFRILLEAIAAGRSLSADEARLAVDGGPYLVPEAALEAGLIDTICFQGEFEAALGLAEGDSLLRLTTREYRDADALSAGTARRAVGMVFVVGDILPGKSRDNLMGRRVAASETIADAIEDAAADDGVEAIVVRVSSPGGSAGASDEIRDAIVKAKTKKPVVISMGDVAASGGYWISSGANRILADATTITGSIGVFALRPVLHRFYDKIGLTYEELRRGRNPDIFTTPRPWTEEQRGIMQRGIDHIYTMFLNKVAEGRNLSVPEVEAIASGRVWSGTAAEGIRLVDRLGGVLDAIDEAKSLASIPADEEVEILVFPKERSILERIRGGDFGIRSAAGTEVRGLLARYDLDALDFLPYTEEEGPLWAYLPFALRE